MYGHITLTTTYFTYLLTGRTVGVVELNTTLPNAVVVYLSLSNPAIYSYSKYVHSGVRRCEYCQTSFWAKE